jgi:hypothetical protein
MDRLARPLFRDEQPRQESDAKASRDKFYDKVDLGAAGGDLRREAVPGAGIENDLI